MAIALEIASFWILGTCLGHGANSGWIRSFGWTTSPCYGNNIYNRYEAVPLTDFWNSLISSKDLAFRIHLSLPATFSLPFGKALGLPLPLVRLLLPRFLLDGL